MKTENQIDKLDILRYSSGILSRKEMEKIEEELSTSDKYLVKIAHTIKNIEEKGCKRARGLFKGFYSGRLRNEKDRVFVREHITYCNRCFEEYHHLVEKEDQGIIDIAMGYIKNFAFSKGVIPAFRPAVLTAKSKDRLPEIKNLCELSKSGISATVTDDSKGNLKVYLKSKKYDISGITVSICKKTRFGLEPAASAITSNRGIAHLGKIKDIPAAKGKGGYILYISGLRA